MGSEEHDLLDAAEDMTHEDGTNKSFQEDDGPLLFQEPRAPQSDGKVSGGLGYCAPEPIAATLWGIVFHLSLFATFFLVFFQFALKPKYTHSQESLAQMMGALAMGDVDAKTKAVATTLLNQQAKRADAALSKRQKENDRLIGAATVPVAALWILTIGWGVMVRNRGHKVLPSMKGAGLMFLCFLVAEILIFTFVVKKYSPLNGPDIVEIYKDAFRKRLQRCKGAKTPGGEELPINRITDAMLGRPQPRAPQPSQPTATAPAEVDRTTRAGPLTIQTKIFHEGA